MILVAGRHALRKLDSQHSASETGQPAQRHLSSHAVDIVPQPMRARCIRRKPCWLRPDSDGALSLITRSLVTAWPIHGPGQALGAASTCRSCRFGLTIRPANRQVQPSTPAGYRYDGGGGGGRVGRGGGLTSWLAPGMRAASSAAETPSVSSALPPSRPATSSAVETPAAADSAAAAVDSAAVAADSAAAAADSAAAAAADSAAAAAAHGDEA